MSDKRVVEWWEHPRIGELDDYVEKYFDSHCKDDYYSQFNAIHIFDFKTEITRWIEDYTAMWTGLQDLVDELPDEEHEEYEIEGEEVRPLESKAKRDEDD